MSINKKAMLVYLNISTWTGRKYDQKISREIEDKYNSNDAGRYNKLLIAGDSVQNIRRIVSEARTFHYHNTLPWSDNGARLLPAANYFHYVNSMQKFTGEYEKEVENFISLYPQLKKEALYRLNGMYLEEDYPDTQTLTTKYSFQTQISPVPDADDFRVTLQKDEVEAIRETIEEQAKEATAIAMKDLWQRLFKVVEHLVERLKKTDNKFKNSLVSNISELCDLLPKLNITDDPKLAEAVNEIKSKLTGHDPQTLREDHQIRNKTAKDAQKILNKMRPYLSAA